MSDDTLSNERFKVMERKLYYGITMPGGIITLGLGLWLLFGYTWEIYANSGWLHAKLTLIVLLIIYHSYCGKLLQDFKYDRNRYTHVFYRWFNEFPVIILIGVTILVVVKP
jgi:putative membrane protein